MTARPMEEDRGPVFDGGGLWNSLPNPALLLDAEGRILAANAAAEIFFATSERNLAHQLLGSLAGETSRVSALVSRVAETGRSMAEYDVDLSWLDASPRLVDLHAAVLGQGRPGAGGKGEGAQVILLVHPRTIAETMDRSLSYRDAARSITGMAAMLAHEVKNPLAGISGAAQLLEMSVGEDERELTRLIRDETVRIGKLLDRVEQFGLTGPTRSEPVNIHDVLDRAVKAAKAGFANTVRFVEEYDPSLPPVMGDADQLIQAFLNLLKNAAEAAPEMGGQITVRTSYSAGIKVMTPSGKRASLPLQVTITDNGAGVPESMQRHIFEPFVTSKSSGSGLGLALVAKVVAEHGGVIACESEPGRTRMRLRLPIAGAAEVAAFASGGDAAGGASA
jgi:two-component system nitrogen regulation sensor histidine kinase GlnL